MEPVSLAVGVIPLVFECTRLAFSIQKICENVGGEFQRKRDRLCVDIQHLRKKMIAVEDAEPSGTALKDDVEKLKSNLKSLECDLQPLISKRWIRRIFDYEKIEKGLDEALDLVEKCEKSFQVSTK
ncbi:hypothetical protein FRC03_000973 [Tulasnella sp. 419]|nr:hypothetical protein FRC03_000973 [Tulasnella sp. 419]